MLDFASSLYLGFEHPHAALVPWDRFTLGRPAALQEPPGARAAARELAALAGCEAGTLLPSTLHLFWDLLGLLAREPVTLLVDAQAYPVLQTAALHWAGRGVPLVRFHGAQGLARALQQHAAPPLVLADGWHPGADRQPDLAAYAALAARRGGRLVVDDTQAFGVHGAHGGGTFARLGLRGPHLLLGASLAKGFGAPLALLAGPAPLLARFEAASQARVHSSPPSAAAVAAARHALLLNRREGGRRRRHLARAVQHLRRALAAAGLPALGGDFPVQTVALPAATDVQALQQRLQRRGLLAVPLRGPRLGLIANARHSAREIDAAVALVQRELAAAGAPP